MSIRPPSWIKGDAGFRSLKTWVVIVSDGKTSGPLAAFTSKKEAQSEARRLRRGSWQHAWVESLSVYDRIS